MVPGTTASPNIESKPLNRWVAPLPQQQGVDNEGYGEKLLPLLGGMYDTRMGEFSPIPAGLRNIPPHTVCDS